MQLDVHACRAPVSLTRSQDCFQLGRLLRVNVDQPDHTRNIEWQREANVPAVWMCGVEALCWVNGVHFVTPKTPIGRDEVGEHLDLFRMWSDRYATKTWRISLSKNADEWSWYRIGAVSRIDYGSTKWTGKYEEYMHEVDHGTTLYVANVTAQQQFCLCKGRLTITREGLEN